MGCLVPCGYAEHQATKVLEIISLELGHRLALLELEYIKHAAAIEPESILRRDEDFRGYDGLRSQPCIVYRAQSVRNLHDI